MKKTGTFLLHLFYGCIIAAVGNCITISKMAGSNVWVYGCIILLLFINIMPSFANLKLKTGKLRNSANGCELLRLFLLSTVMAIAYSVIGWIGRLPLGTLIEEPAMWIFNSLVIYLVECIVFWNGIIRIYITSEQLAVRWRVIGALCGMIPIVHLIVLRKMLHIVEKEIETENQKLVLDEQRASEQICRTKYPILMVHGVFFRDSNYFNYWGRIPQALEKNGATILYGNHQSAASVIDCGDELTKRIQEIVQQTGCEKVNIIAHSKGGLDCRYAISKLGAAPFVASLTTINTPHRGCEFADYLLTKISKKKQLLLAKMYNSALKKFGDTNPDFLAAVYDLTASSCRNFNEHIPDMPEVYYQSVGSKLNVASGGRFPLNFSYQIVNYFDGNNDGLVGENSFIWGEKYQFLTVSGKRGISHGDVIDLNRENFDDFDVREFYVQLVNELRQKGF